MVRRGSFGLMKLVVYLTTTLLPLSEAFSDRRIRSIERSDWFELSVIHINDFHARFIQTSRTSGTCNEDSEAECVGGIARLYTATHQLVNQRPNAIFLNAGDSFQGTLWFNVFGWNVTATFMNMLPHDASVIAKKQLNNTSINQIPEPMQYRIEVDYDSSLYIKSEQTLGNHEFDNRIAGLVPYLKALNSPVVVTNIDDSEEPEIQGLYQNSTIIERNGTQIGIIGVILSTTNTIASTEKLKFLDEVETVNAEAERLKAQGVEIIIVLSHCGFEVDKVMAASCPNIDLVVGGHSNTFLYSGPQPDIETPVGDYPYEVIQADSGRTVLIVQAYAFSKYVGNLSVWFDKTGEVVDWEGNPILLDSSVEQNPDVLAALMPWKEEVDAYGLRVIGSTKVLLYNNCRFGECNIGNFITDAMINVWTEFAENSTFWTYAAVACTHVGGIRAGIGDTTEEITYSDAVLAQPFGDSWDVLELQGSSLIKLLEESVSISRSETEFVGAGGFLQWSGIRVTFNLSNEAYSRVTSLKVRCRACDIPVYEDVVLDEWYRIVLNSFIVPGTNSLTVLATDSRNHEVGTVGIDHFVNYIAKMSPITTGIEGRITIDGTWSG